LPFLLWSLARPRSRQLLWLRCQFRLDEPIRRHVTEIYRQAAEEAAGQGIESALSWHTLAIWTDEGKERIGYF